MHETLEQQSLQEIEHREIIQIITKLKDNKRPGEEIFCAKML